MISLSFPSIQGSDKDKKKEAYEKEKVKKVITLRYVCNIFFTIF